MLNLRELTRQLLHRAVLRCGFSLNRVKPFERALLKHQLMHDDFFLVQIGAFNGVTSDPFCKFILEKSWSAVLVEPQRRYCDVLREIYRDRAGIVCRNVAIGATNETRKFYRIADDAQDLPYWAPQLASFRYEVLVSHANEIPDIASKIVAEDMECVTLQRLVAEAGIPRMDLLAIDVEGSDFEVLQQIDTLPMKPQFIYYEHLHLVESDYRASLAFLAARSYRTHSVNAGDTFAELI
jgi:FkbM family methyltransferase